MTTLYIPVSEAFLGKMLLLAESYISMSGSSTY